MTSTTRARITKATRAVMARAIISVEAKATGKPYKEAAILVMDAVKDISAGEHEATESQAINGLKSFGVACVSLAEARTINDARLAEALDTIARLQDRIAEIDGVTK